MSKPGSPQTTYLAGDDPETIAANRAYQDALSKLTDSLNSRKNRLFDPVLLAAAQGFLAPTQTGSFGESLGNAAAKIGAAESAAFKERQELDEQRLLLASRGLEMQRQKSRQAMANRFLQEEQTGALPGGQANTAGQRGFQIAPPDPKRLTGRQYLQMALAEGMPYAEALQKAEVIDRENIQAKESGVFNIREGRFFPTQYKEVPFQINGKTYNIPEGTALELSHLARIGDVEGFNRESRKAIRDFGQSAAAPQAVQQTSPQLAAQAAAPQGGAAAATSVQPPAAAGSPVGQVQERIRQITEDFAGKTGPAQAAGTAAAPSTSAARVTAPQGGAQAAQGLPAAATSAAAARVPTPQAAAALPQAAPPVVPQAAPSAAARPATVVVPPATVPPTQAAAVPAAVPSAAVQAAPVAPAASGRDAAAGTTGRPGLLSVQESESIKAREKALQEADVQMEIEARKDFNQRFRDAGDSITMANMLRRFSEDPNASKMTGILNNDKISSGIARLVKDGVGARDYRIGIAAIEDVMRNAGLNPADQAKYRVFLMNTAQMRLQMSKYMKGSVSNYEQDLMGEAAVSSQDTPQTIRMKADLLARRAQFDRKAYRAFKASRMTAEEFLDSDQYQKMRDEYDKQLTGISVGALRYQSSTSNPATNAPARGAPTAPAQGGNTGNAAAGNRLRELLNRPPQRRP